MRATDGTGQQGHPSPRHVWVNITGTADDDQPGVLLDWRRAERGRWEALVVRAEGGGMRQARAHVEWVLAEHVRPAG